MGKTLAIALISSMILVILGGMTSLASSSDDLTDQQKQLEIQKMVDNHRSALPTELVLAIIRQEGGEGAFHIDGWDYNNFYSHNDGPWAQPTNGDGIMQVANTDYHEDSGPYTHDQNGYDNAINDGCNYLLWHYNTYGTYVQSVLYYNAGRGSLYTYLGKNWGDRNYLSNVATHLSNFVPNTYGLQNQNLVESLNQGQSILDDYLYNRGIETGRSLDYYSQYQVQLDNDLNNILDSNSANLQTDMITLTLYVHEGSASGPVIPGALVTGNDGSCNSFVETTDSSGYVTITGDPGIWSFSVSADKYETNSWDQEITETDTKDAYLQRPSGQSSISNPPITPIEIWDKTFGKGSLDSVIHSDNGYVAAGYTYTRHYQNGVVEDCSEYPNYESACDEDAFLIKVDYDGNEIWRKAFGDYRYGIAYSVQPTKDGGYLLEGVISDRFTGSNHWLIKTDPAGNEVWNRTFMGINRVESVQPTSDGGFVIATEGYYLVDSRFYSHNPIKCLDYDVYLFKIDSAGDMVWDRAYDIFSMSLDDYDMSTYDYDKFDDYVTSMAITGDGGYILAGNPFGWIMKTDSEGDQIWRKTTITEMEFSAQYPRCGSEWSKIRCGNGYYIYNYTRTGEMINEILPIDGGYILIGCKDVESAKDDAWLSKIDSEGNEIWSKTFGGTGSDDANLIQTTQDGGYIIGGSTRYSGEGNIEVWLTKVDSEGNEIWSKNLGEIYNWYGAWQIQPTQDGGYIFKDRTWMFKVDSQGNEVWNKTFYRQDSHGYPLQYIGSILPTADGGCVIAGQNLSDAWMSKIDADGQLKIMHSEREMAPASETSSNVDDIPIDAEKSPLTISAGAVSLITAVLFMKKKRDHQ